MAKRVTNIGVSVEYVDTYNKRRVTNIGISIEYKGDPNYMRETNIGGSIEYQDTTILHMLRGNIVANNATRSGGRQ